MNYCTANISNDLIKDILRYKEKELKEKSKSKTIMTDIEFDVFDEDYPLITWIKGVTGQSTGRIPSVHSDGHL